MSRWATVCVIAGVSFTGCRAELIDANEFLDDYAESGDWGNDSTMHIQGINRGVKGLTFGIKFASIEISKINNVRSAVAAAKASKVTFRITITDDPFDIDVNGSTDPTAQGGWLQYPGLHSEGWAEDVTMRFVAKSVYTP